MIPYKSYKTPTGPQKFQSRHIGCIIINPIQTMNMTFEIKLPDKNWVFHFAFVKSFFH